MYRDPDNHISLEVGLGAGEPTGWGGGGPSGEGRKPSIRTRFQYMFNSQVKKNKKTP